MQYFMLEAVRPGGAKLRPAPSGCDKKPDLLFGETGRFLVFKSAGSRVSGTVSDLSVVEEQQQQGRMKRPHMILLSQATTSHQEARVREFQFLNVLDLFN
eukprot:TRINITY_DN113996_c0_g1_i1.p1 TRINITY_DN113996_c0_g1~~TRINITY_DN113996_c0_g1_i1.p1  ORF type:complete len:100 (-),score=9.03 TRINITY_DN113996_c0_g1_i1:98-397(-)